MADPTYVQTARGATGFVKMVADTANGGTMPSLVHLGDSVTVVPNQLGGFVVVRTADAARLQATGLVISGASTLSAFQAGVLAGQGAGTPT